LKPFENMRTGIITNTTNKLKHVVQRKKREHGSLRKAGRLKISMLNMRPTPPSTKLMSVKMTTLISAAAFI
jgi:hypothetical protein